MTVPATGSSAGGLRVLITNTRLVRREGSELYVRDLALDLLKRGHTPVVYSPHLGSVAEEIRRGTVPVIDDLERLGTPPDIIHGQHNLETMAALARFPNVPAVYFCHSWLFWEETPPRHPRILRYVAVDHTVRDRLIHEHGIDTEQAITILNFVDLARFRPRPPLPDRPQRALVFSNHASEHNYVGIVREACARHGIAVDVVGLSSGNPTDRPENLLGGYDLVFCKARAAIESLAVGNAVVLCDAIGSGPMVTSANLDQLRPLNFGMRTLSEPLTADVLSDQIAGYDPADAARVSALMRSTAGLVEAVDAILALYRQVRAEWEESATSAPDGEAIALARYLRWLSLTFTGQLVAERDAFHGQLQQVVAERDALRQQTRQLAALRDALYRQIRQLIAQRDAGRGP